MRVLVEGSAFARHARSGITRYFTELLRAFERQPDLGIEPVTPYRYIANKHLAEALPGHYRAVPLPSGQRARVLDILNTRRRHRAVDADLVHHSLYRPELLDAFPGVPSVCTVYDFTAELFPDLFPGWQGGLVDKAAVLAGCDGLLCISETTRRDLRRLCPDLDVPVMVTPLGVSDEFFRPRPLPRPVTGRYVLHTGNRHANKRADVLFQAFAQIAPTWLDVTLVLCGNPLTRAESMRLADLGIAERTTCLRVNDAHLPGLYSAAALFAFPSCYEGFGLPVVEAMASGCPVVAADTPALVEVADEAARYFPVDDVSALAAQLDVVLADGSERERLRAAGRSRAAEFSWATTAARSADAYRLIRAAA